ncbi:hypothetical protein CBP34_06480 [Acidovorax carolinensis]|uniref:PIN domain-containing protein n=1 Tax=Acidovorax carolinensis TaxID=553814 RepID=A0A240U0L9_9BURK|nr:hypothetical protein CBP34_06480 [Acidovorax carolinensis]
MGTPKNPCGRQQGRVRPSHAGCRRFARQQVQRACGNRGPGADKNRERVSHTALRDRQNPPAACRGGLPVSSHVCAHQPDPERPCARCIGGVLQHACRLHANRPRRYAPSRARGLLNPAHARAEGWVLVTNNAREFCRVEGLAVENWVTPKQKHYQTNSCLRLLNKR